MENEVGTPRELHDVPNIVCGSYVGKVASIVGEDVIYIQFHTYDCTILHYTIIQTVYMTNRICMSNGEQKQQARAAAHPQVPQPWLPAARKPDKAFIENYESIVPDIVELANYNIGLQEAGRARLLWKGYVSPQMTPKWRFMFQLAIHVAIYALGWKSILIWPGFF